jgi:hypothetical protein
LTCPKGQVHSRRFLVGVNKPGSSTGPGSSPGSGQIGHCQGSIPSTGSCSASTGAGAEAFLTTQLRRIIASEDGAATSYLDEKVFRTLEAMQVIATAVAADGEKLKEFTKQYDLYPERRQEAEADPTHRRGRRRL